jgi:hypothetical protein
MCSIHPVDDQLYVIGVVSNPMKYTRRYELFNEWVDMMLENPKISLITAELQQGDREFQTNSMIKLRTKHILWHKENLINLAIQHLPCDWKYVAWIDTDIVFTRDDWAEETLHQLQIYDIVQLFSHAIDLGPNNETLQVHAGFVYQYMAGHKPTKRYENFHPGYAWACTRDAFNSFGGLIDFAIVGSADRYMALAFIGRLTQYMDKRWSKNYKDFLVLFQDRCTRHIKKNIGFVDGTILHSFHGAKRNRQYKERNEILAIHKFDPIFDIMKDYQGLYQLDDVKIDLRDDLRTYFKSRNEDSIDV